MTDPKRMRIVDQALLEEAADRADFRRASVFIVSRLLLPFLFALVIVGLALVMMPHSAALAVAAVALFVLFGLTSLFVDRNRFMVGRWAGLSTLAALVQASFYTVFIIGAVFFYVVRAPILLSGIVAANLFGLLFWRFRRRYLDAADEADADI